MSIKNKLNLSIKHKKIGLLSLRKVDLFFMLSISNIIGAYHKHNMC